MPIRRIRQTGAALRRPVEVTKQPKAPTRQSMAGASLFGSGERKGYTQQYVEELVEKAPGGIDPGSKKVLDPYQEYLGINPLTGGATYLWPVTPQYSFHRLCQLPVMNNALGLCIEAYVTNIESYGYVLEYIGDEGGEDLPRVKQERAKLEAFLAFVSPENTFREVREKARRDRETLGNCFYEIARNQLGEVTLFDHLPANTMRVTRKDPTPVEVDIDIPDPGNPGKYIHHKVIRYFRRFVQLTPTFKKVYFKELGDPRPIDPDTGELNESLDIEEEATEVHWSYNYTPGYLYGLPRWIGQLPSILGSRESEMVNLNFFRENAIPAMVVLVSGGALTQESYDKVRDYVNAIRGQRAMNRVMVLEAQVDDNMGGLDHSQPAPRIDIKPMISERQQEGLFQDYDQKNIQKIRSSFRLPPIFGGRSEDYTRASAYASMQVAETQIFMPERSAFDQIFNQRILGTHRPKWHRFRSVGPSMVDAASISQMVTALGNQGGLTPNIAIKLVNQVLNVQVKPVPSVQKWGDYPMDAIIEYIRAGVIIEGMDDFIKDLGALAQPPAAAPGAKPKTLPAKKPVTKREQNDIANLVKLELVTEVTDMVERLMDARLEGLQTATPSLKQTFAEAQE